MLKLKKWIKYYFYFIKEYSFHAGKSYFWTFLFQQRKAINLACDMCDWDNAMPDQRKKWIDEWYESGAEDVFTFL